VLGEIALVGAGVFDNVVVSTGGRRLFTEELDSVVPGSDQVAEELRQE
jgi:hypothetical protein